MRKNIWHEEAKKQSETGGTWTSDSVDSRCLWREKKSHNEARVGRFAPNAERIFVSLWCVDCET